MKVQLDLEKQTCKVIREAGDPVFKRGGWSDAESTFLYHVKQELRRMGYDVIKKRMWKDGNMVSDDVQWVRTRRFSKPGDFALWNNFYQVFDVGEQFNKYGEVQLSTFVISEYDTKELEDCAINSD